MKKIILIFLLVVASNLLKAQIDLDYGFKGGLNYNANGDLNITGGFGGFNEDVNSNSEIGYHLGIFTKINFDKFYLRPELVYTKTKSSYEHQTLQETDFKLTTLDIPILLGYELIKPVSVFAGPYFQYIFYTDFSDAFDLELEKDIGVGLSFGAAVQIDRLGFDIRYNTGLSKNSASYTDDLPVDGLAYAIDTKSKQLILSVFFQLK